MNEQSDHISNQPDAARISEPLRAVAHQALNAGREAQAAAVDLANSSAEAVKAHVSEFVGAAKDVASHAEDRLQEQIANKKGAGADYVANFADTLRRAANEFDPEMPVAGRYIRAAAARVGHAADALRTGNFDDLVSGAQSFARNQPAAFFGLATLAGFGAVRFLRSSAPMPSSAGETQSSGDELAASSAPDAAPAPAN